MTKYFYIGALVIFVACKPDKKADDQVFCQSYVYREIVSNPEGEISRTFSLSCDKASCGGTDSCTMLEKTYNPPQPNGLTKLRWCGCPGDTDPNNCGPVIRTYNMNGRVVEQADCMGGCPVESDTCLQKPSKILRNDTIRNVAGKDSLYIFKDQIICECEKKP